MSRKIPKTLNRKLRDLDDHLYLLEDALSRLSAGESAHLKTLSAELRVLVCWSSGTEGLLWRIADELGVEDDVHVHLAGNVNHEHPLSKDISFSFIPLIEAGKGDPRLTPNRYSLKGILKKLEALTVLGRGYTHEQLIKHVAQQIGSAHEDDGAQRHIVELSQILLGNEKMLIKVLKSDARYVLEIGSRVMESASKVLGFSRSPRTTFTTSETIACQHTQDDSKEFDEDSEGVTEEGSIVYMVDHPDSDWMENARGYSFDKFKKGVLSVSTTKHGDGSIELGIVGLSDHHSIITRHKVGRGKQPGLMIAITWQENRVSVYINGELVNTIDRMLKE